MLPTTIASPPFTPWNRTQADNFTFSPPYSIEERQNLSQYLQQGNIEPILESPRLFWLLFCTTFHTLQQSQGFRWDCHEEQFSYRPRGFLNEILHSSLERVRCALCDGHKTSLPTILFPATHKMLQDSEGETFLLPLSQDHTADFSAIGSCQDIPSYSTIFLPCLVTLIRSLGGQISTQVIQPQILNCWWFKRSAAQSGEEALFIDFPKPQRSYPIPPADIPLRTLEEQQENLYNLYQKQLLCDTTLFLDDGHLQVHATALFFCGGEIIKQLLLNPMQSTETKGIALLGFSKTTASAFADFIYRGPETVERNEDHVYELLRLAYCFQIEPLINSCTNLISRVTSAKDAEWIGELAEHYNNPHLKALYEHLSIIEN